MRHDLNAIVLVDQNWGIGHEGQQHIFIKEDLERFQSLTTEKTIIVGRKTLATFPNQAPLKNRRNLILSSNSALRVGRGAKVYSDLLSVFSAITAQESVFVVGGASVYETFLPFCNTVYVTKVHQELQCDCHFPNLDEMEPWNIVEESEMMESEGVSFQYLKYEK